MRLRAWTLLAILIIAFLLVNGQILPAGRAQTPVPGDTSDRDQLRSVSVVGIGRVTAQPDLAIVNIGVTKEAETAELALSENNEQMQAVLGTIRAAGVRQQDIRTVRFQLLPLYEEFQRPPSSPRLTGFTAVHIVEASIHDINGVGEIIDAAIEAGGTTVEGIRFEVSDPSALLDQARAAAMNDAAHKSAQLAELADAELAEVIMINESSRTPLAGIREEFARADVAVPIEPGIHSIEVEVFVTWRLR